MNDTAKTPRACRQRLAERLGPLGYRAREISGEVPALMKGL